MNIGVSQCSRKYNISNPNNTDIAQQFIQFDKCIKNVQYSNNCRKAHGAWRNCYNAKRNAQAQRHNNIYIQSLSATLIIEG